MWKHLLVPLDFSDCAARALELGAALAEREHAALTLLHVSPLPANLAPDVWVTPPSAAEAVRVGDYMAGGARQRLEAMAAPLRERGFEVRTLAVPSTSEDVADALLRIAREVGADAIVVGTHGRAGLAHFLLGSVAERVIRRAPIPVISVRAEAAEAQPTREERFAEDELTG